MDNLDKESSDSEYADLDDYDEPYCYELEFLISFLFSFTFLFYFPYKEAARYDSN